MLIACASNCRNSEPDLTNQDLEETECNVYHLVLFNDRSEQKDITEEARKKRGRRNLECDSSLSYVVAEEMAFLQKCKNNI